MIGDMEWCEECGTRREVVDEHEESVLSSGYMWTKTIETPYWVVDFLCGHSKSWKRGEGVAYRD